MHGAGQRRRAHCNGSNDHHSLISSSPQQGRNHQRHHKPSSSSSSSRRDGSKKVLAVDTGNGTGDMDEKYTKRDHQRKKRKMWMVLGSMVSLLAVSLLIMITTSSNQQHQSDGSIGIAGSGRTATSGNGPSSVAQGQHPKSNSRIRNAVDNISKSLLRGNGGSGGGGGGVGETTTHATLKKKNDAYLQQLLQNLDESMINNSHSGIKWMNPELLLSLDRDKPNPVLIPRPHQHDDEIRRRNKNANKYSHHGVFFRVSRLRSISKAADKSAPIMAWERHDKEMTEAGRNDDGPKVDYTNSELYSIPSIQLQPPMDGSYPKLKSLKQLMIDWPQDDIDNPPRLRNSDGKIQIEEVLQRFDYQNETELNAAIQYREHKLPFKVYNVPELQRAKLKWTDEYVSSQFDMKNPTPDSSDGTATKRAQGTCQESSTNFFAFYTPKLWDVEIMGLPPTRNNDYTFEKWSQHAIYADRVGLDFDQPHYYWQSGVPREERLIQSGTNNDGDNSKKKNNEPQWTFISRDLPSFSSAEETFFVFSPEDQKGIQCRFGERGVTAATHFDSGRNMIAMITGAKRYILSPPRECSKLGISTDRHVAIFRHSLLNFGHLIHLDDPTKVDEMPEEERAWLQRAGQADAFETVLKAGEVLYLPSHYFHYITSLQKSAQCNVRSGVDYEGDVHFGGSEDVTTRCEI